jgi:peptidoglycan/xylan/chitin deacetylase (PgdA/CDA1 family)
VTILVVRRRRLQLVAAAVALGLAVTVGYVVVAARVTTTAAISPSVLRSVATTRPFVALTFDDGPSAATPVILNILGAYRAQATFFVIGSEVERYPAICRRILAEGHQIGNHTYSHRYLSRWPLPVAVTEVQGGERAIRDATGVKPRLFRFPGFMASAAQIEAVLQMGYRVVGMRVDSKDWRPGSEKNAIVHNVLSQVRPGDIILFHDGGGRRAVTVAALPEILSQLKARGFRFVTVSDLMRIGRQEAPTPSSPQDRKSRWRAGAGPAP